jgi:hypothetical protein
MDRRKRAVMRIFVEAQEGCISVVYIHLKDLGTPQKLSIFGDSVFAINIDEDDYDKAVNRVREHLRPVCGVTAVY